MKPCDFCVLTLHTIWHLFILFIHHWETYWKIFHTKLLLIEFFSDNQERFFVDCKSLSSDSHKHKYGDSCSRKSTAAYLPVILHACCVCWFSWSRRPAGNQWEVGGEASGVVRSQRSRRSDGRVQPAPVSPHPAQQVQGKSWSTLKLRTLQTAQIFYQHLDS